MSISFDKKKLHISRENLKEEKKINEMSIFKRRKIGQPKPQCQGSYLDKSSK